MNDNLRYCIRINKWRNWDGQAVNKYFLLNYRDAIIHEGSVVGSVEDAIRAALGHFPLGEYYAVYVNGSEYLRAMINVVQPELQPA